MYLLSSRARFPVLITILCGVGIVFSGCGTSGDSPGSVAPVKNCIANSPSPANVPVLFTSDAALGPLTIMEIGIQSFTLTDACGQSATVYTSPVRNTVQSTTPIEFAHVNGVSEPLTVATLPRATYTSATITYNDVELAFIYPDALHFDASDVVTDPIHATVQFDQPITVGSSGTTISLDALVSKPVDITAQNALGYNATVTPVFRVTSFTPAASPANDRDGLANVRGLTQSAGTGQFNMTNSAGLPLSISVSSATTYQGFGNFAALPLKAPVDVNVAIQADGSLLATRVQAEYPAALGNWTGPLVQTYSTGAYQSILPRLWQEPADPGHTFNIFPFRFQFTGNTAFQHSGASYDLTDLPFVPRFSSFADVAVGQELSINWVTQQLFGNQPQTEAYSATLVPRTFSGVLQSMSSQGSYVVYTLTLVPTDMMNPLSNTSSIQAYTNAGTRMEDGALYTGELVNMHGLLFNDNGTLRLVCDQTRLQRTP